MRSVHKAAGVAVLGVLLAITGCDSGSSGVTPPGQPTTPPSTVNATQGTDMRSRLAQALQSDHPQTAQLVKNSSTTLDEVELDGLSGWTLLDVQNQRPPHPQRVAVALSDSGDAKLLSGDPDAFNSVVRSNLGQLNSERAVTLARTYLDLTRDTTTWSYRVESIEDIKWLPKPTDAQAKRRDQVKAKFGGQIAAPKAVSTSGGWTLTLWTVAGTELVKHAIVIDHDGGTTDDSSVVARDLPVPSSV